MYKYIQFPLFLLRNLLRNPYKTVDTIFDYGIYHLSQHTITYDRTGAAKEALYQYYRGKCGYSGREKIEKLFKDEILIYDSDYDGFTSKGEFHADGCDELTTLEYLLEEDAELDKDIKMFYCIKKASDFLEVKLPNHYSVEKMQNLCIPDKEPMPMAKVEHLFRFLKESKTEEELFEFAASIGVRSILGKKKYCKTTKENILARALGYKSRKHMSESLPPIMEKYLKRYHFDKLRHNLEEKWGLHFYSHKMRGFFVGKKDKISLEDLVAEAEKSKKSYKEKKRTSEHKRIREEFLKRENLKN